VKSLKSLKVPLLCILVSIVIDLIGLALDHFLGARWLSATIFAWTLSMLPMGVLLYWLRCVHRLAYGMFEMIVSLGVLYFVLSSMVFTRPSTEMSLHLLTNRALTLFAVVYFMVRALDNIGEGLRPGTPMHARWSVLFPKPAK
jgi:hypothetical protein